MKPFEVPSEERDALGDFRRSAWLRRLERLALVIERPFTRLGGAPALNPFYHTGTLAVFLWLVVALTGLYLTLFYQFGFEASYHSVAKIEGQLLAHVIRAVHRYASGTAMIFTLLHGFRLFFLDRFRGPRWLAWVTGVVMLGFLWLDGTTGYWLVWDQRAQLITDSFTALLDRFPPLGAAFTAGLLNIESADQSWVFSFILWVVHFLLFGGVALFFWWHILRLSRPRFLPARHWLFGVGAVLLVISAAFPLGMLPLADFRQLPGVVTLDPFFLFFIPFSLQPAAGWLWAALLLLFVMAGAIPWLSLRRASEPIRIASERCAGCGACAADCPYQAIRMQPRPGSEQTIKPVAVVDPYRCVSCGVCLGSCNTGAISLGNLSEAALWSRVQDRLGRQPQGKAATLVFTCERHAAQGARPYLQQDLQAGANDQPTEVIPLPCVAALPPGMVARALAGGAGEVRVVGCPPDDCARREGNLWAEGRLTRTRLPQLKKSLANAPVHTFWLSPDAFAEALPGVPRRELAAKAEKLPARQPGAAFSPRLTWRNFLPAFGVLGLLIVLQVWVTQAWSFQAYSLQEAWVKLVIPDPAALEHAAQRFSQEYGAQPARLQLSDGKHVLSSSTLSSSTLFEQEYFPTAQGHANPLVVELPLAPGQYHWILSLTGGLESQATLVLYQQTATLNGGQVWIILFDPARQPGRSHKGR